MRTTRRGLLLTLAAALVVTLTPPVTARAEPLQTSFGEDLYRGIFGTETP